MQLISILIRSAGRMSIGSADILAAGELSGFHRSNQCQRFLTASIIAYGGDENLTAVDFPAF